MLLKQTNETMKKFLVLPAILIALFSTAQENLSGKIVYEQTVKLEIKLEGDASQFADMLPKERKSNKVLYFNQEASLYENGEAVENEASTMSSGGNITIQMKEPENKVFTDLKKKKQIEQREFMTRMFLIEGEKDIQWKLTGQQKMILDLPCQEAETEIDSVLVSVWFTPAIPVSAGPANYGGLPGLILEVNSDGGDRTLVATSVDLSPVNAEVLEIPKKGRKVTREEYDKIVEEKMKEMGAQKGEGGHMMMIRIEQ